ncbi:MAG: ATP-dependent zinc protease [Synechococcales cyanobacterium RU_4_20]|nr:ATP-dependent zinc protease [Synechococcales cyanobacterium RU_4_20]NJR70474.1 ATP-dependent zinc protease [Synechococcales cyanobacterium CRU_2_2]
MIGWREWVALPELKINRIKAKVDTGARSSALHAFNLKSFRRDGITLVRFDIHPLQRSKSNLITIVTELIDERYVRSSNGKKQLRPVIHTPVALGAQQWPIELTLTDRDAMGFRMLLGRQAIRKRFLIDPGRSYLQKLVQSKLPT